MSVLIRVAFFSAWAWVCSAGAAVGQTPAPKSPGKAQAIANGAVPTSSSATNGTLPGVLLFANRGEKKAEARTQFFLAGGAWRLGLDASVPLDQPSTEDVTLLDLKGLKGTEMAGASIGFTNFEFTADTERRTRICQRRDAEVGTPEPACAASTFTRRADLEWEPLVEWDAAPSDSVRLGICERYRREVLGKQGRAPGPLCARGLLGWDPWTEFEAAGDWGTPFQAATSIRVGTRSLKYADVATLEQEAVDTWPLEFTVGASFFLRGTGEYLGLSYSYDRSWKETDKKSTCVPGTPAGSSVCSESAIGAPARRVKHIGTLEYRWFISPRVGVNPQVSYELATHDFAIGVPVYFLADSTGGLTGGVSLGYETETDSPVIEIFVGTRLGFAIR